MLAVEILPYSDFNSLRFSPIQISIERKSLRSRINRPWSSAILKHEYKIPVCVSLSSSKFDNNSGPISLTVVRIGWPFLPNKSQKTTGLPSIW